MLGTGLRRRELLNCRRYGVFNCVMEKIARRLMMPLHSVFMHRIKEITKRHV